jgi:PAS domain S-box-containing protein
MRISTRLKLAILVPVVMALVIGLAFFFSYRTIEEAQDNGRTAHQIQSSMNELNSLVSQYILYREERPRQQFLLEHDSITQLITSVQFRDIEQQQLLDSIHQNSQSMRESFLRLVSNYERAGSAESDALLREAEERLAGQLLIRSHNVLLNALRLESLVNAEIDTTQRRTSTLIFVLIIVCAGFLTLALTPAMTSIITSISALRHGTEVVGAGNLSHRIGMSSRDELGDLASSFDNMTERLQFVTVSKDALQLEVEERKKAEQALRRQEKRYHGTLDGMLEGCQIIGFDWRYVYVNDAAARHGRRARDELLGYTMMEMYPGIENTDMFVRLQQCMTDRTSHRMENEFTYSDGTKSWFELSIQPAPEGVFVLSLDITERRKAEAEVAHLASFPELNPNPVFELDRVGNIKYANPAARTRFPDLSSKGSEHPFLAGWEDIVGTLSASKRLSITQEVKVDDSWFEQTVSAAPLNKDFRVYGRDITERKRAEESLDKTMAELRRSNDELQQFAYVASHDLQEPLRMISSYLQLIEKRYGGKLDTDADDFIKFAVDGASRMQNMIEGLLNYSRVVTKGEPFEPTEPAEALRIAISNVRLTIDETGTVVTHGNLPTVMADGAQLVQLFQNLIINAVNFRGERPPRIHISAEEKGNDCVFSVRDNGIGFPPEYKERIFVLFERLHGFDYPGTGMGLAICKRIVERHGGRIWVESKPGEGSTFYFSLPSREVKNH